MTARARRAFAAFAVALLALAGTACAAIDAMTDTQQALRDAGFRNASASWYSENGVEYVTVTWEARDETGETVDEKSLAAAGVIWRVTPVYFDNVEVNAFSLSGSVRSRVYPRAELEREFGPRPPGLDRDAGDLVNVRAIVTTLVVVALVGLALTTVVIVVVVRGGRRREPVPAAWGPWAAGPPGAGWPASSWPGGQRPGRPPQAPPPGQWPAQGPRPAVPPAAPGPVPGPPPAPGSEPWSAPPG